MSHLATLASSTEAPSVSSRGRSVVRKHSVVPSAQRSVVRKHSVVPSAQRSYSYWRFS